MAEDAGSIYSEVRIKIDQLQKDIATAVSVMDRFGQKVVDTANVASNLFSNSYSKSIKQVESYVKSLDKAVADGALTQRQAINSALEARKEELAYIQATAAKKGGFTDQEIADTKRVKAEISSLTEQQKKLGGETDKTSGSFKLLGLTASTFVIAAFRSLVTASSAYSEALAGVRAATRGSAEDLENLAAAAETSGKAVAASSTEALGAIEALSKAGVSNADIMGGALTGALTLAAAGEMQVADAAEIAAATMTQFGLAGEDVTHIADLLAAGAGKAQGEVSDLSQALKQAGLVASQTGLSVDDTVGSLAAFASAGLLGSDAGTSFRTMLLRLTPQSKEAAEEMKKLGINAFDSSGEFIGITKFAGQLQNQLKGLTTEQRNAALATIFGSDSIRAANVLYTQGAEGIGEWIDKVNDTGFAADTARIKLDSLSGDLKALDAQIATSSAKIGGSLDPTLRGLAQAGTAVIDIVDDLPSPLLAGGIAAGVLAAGIVGLNAGLGLLGISLSFLTGPIGLVVIGLTALTGGIIAATNAVNASNIAEAEKTFGDIGVSAGKSADDIKRFAKAASDAEVFLRAMDMEGTLNSETFKQLAKDLGLTEDELASVAIRSDKTSASVKDLAKAFVDTVAQAKRLSDAAIQAGKEMDDYYRSGLTKEKAYLDSLKSSGKATNEQLERLKTVNGILGIQKAATVGLAAGVKTLSEEIDYQNYLERTGAKATEEALKAKIALRDAEIDRIQEAGLAAGKLSTSDLARVKELQGENKKNQDALDAIKKKTDDQKKAEQELATATKAAATEQEKNLQKISDLRTTDIQKIEQERDVLLAANNAANQSEEERLANEIAINADAAARITAIKKAESDKQAKETEARVSREIRQNKKLADTVLSISSGLASSLGEIFANLASARLDALSESYEADMEAFDEAYQAQIALLDEKYAHELELLEYDGLTKEEYLRKQVEDAKVANDAEALADAEKNLAKYLAAETYEKDKEEAEAKYQAEKEARELAYEKQKAKLSYEASLTQWGLTLASSIASAAMAINGALAAPPFFPLNAGFVTAATALGAAQVAAVASAKPRAPKFATGGIVLPSGNGGRQVTVADNGGGEILFGTGAAGAPLMQEFMDGVASRVVEMMGSSGGDLTIPIYLDSEVLAKSTVRLIDVGRVKMKALPR